MIPIQKRSASDLLRCFRSTLCVFLLFSYLPIGCFSLPLFLCVFKLYAIALFKDRQLASRDESATRNNSFYQQERSQLSSRCHNRHGTKLFAHHAVAGSVRARIVAVSVTQLFFQHLLLFFLEHALIFRVVHL